MDHDDLKSLHTALIDAREGYGKAIEEAEDAELKSIFMDVSGMHASAHADVHKALAEKGEPVDDSGSFMGTVHKAVISVRSAVTGVDQGSLSSFASGEERNVELYDKAIAGETDISSGNRLRHHRDELASAIVRMKQIAERAAV